MKSSAIYFRIVKHNKIRICFPASSNLSFFIVSLFQNWLIYETTFSTSNLPSSTWSQFMRNWMYTISTTINKVCVYSKWTTGSPWVLSAKLPESSIYPLCGLRIVIYISGLYNYTHTHTNVHIPFTASYLSILRTRNCHIHTHTIVCIIYFKLKSIRCFTLCSNVYNKYSHLTRHTLIWITKLLYYYYTP